MRRLGLGYRLKVNGGGVRYGLGLVLMEGARDRVRVLGIGFRVRVNGGGLEEEVGIEKLN